jgi:hypothetical protein
MGMKYILSGTMHSRSMHIMPHPLFISRLDVEDKEAIKQ